ncbi:MAG: PAS domain S-box protein [Acidobacteria bacterium]|nr:PAS domain S-box protein [Acidobacteriota bacterium]
MPQTEHGPFWAPVLDVLPQGVLVVDQGGCILEANGGALKILGMERETLLSLSLFDPRWKALRPDGTLMPVEEFPGLLPVLTGQPALQKSIGLVQPSGDTLWLEASAGPLPGGGAIVSFEDVTERLGTERILGARARIVEVAVRGSLEEVLRATLDEAERLSGSCIGFFHFVDPDQNTLTLQAWSTRTAREFCRAEGAGLHYPVDQAGVWVDALRCQGPVIHNDYASLPHRKGLPEGHAEVKRELVVPVLRAGRVVALLGVGNKPFNYGPRDVEHVQRLADLAWDTAESKRRQASLVLVEERFRTLFESMTEGYAHCRMIYEGDRPVDWSFLSVNPAFEAITGLKGAAGRRVSQLIPAIQEAAPDLFETFGRVARIGVPETFESFVPPLGIWIAVRAFSPAPEELVATFEDITARKRDEQDLQEKEAKFRALFDESPLGIWEEDFSEIQGRIERLRASGVEDLRGHLKDHPEAVLEWAGLVKVLEVNQASVELLGAPTKEEILRTLPAYFTPASLDVFREEILALAAGHRRFRSEIPLVNLRGEAIVFDLALSVRPGFEDTWARVQVSFVDITEKKRIRDALEASELRARTMLRTALEGIWLLDDRGKLLEVNDAACRMSGYSRDELQRMSIPDLEAAETPEETAAHVARVIERGFDLFETRHRRKDGTAFPVEISVTFLPESKQQVVFLRDISERKAAEEQIASEKRRFQNMVDSVDGIVWEFDVRTFCFTYVSAQAERLLGYALEDWKAPGFWVDHLHPEDRDWAMDFCLSCTKRLEDHDFEYRFQAKDGRYLWLRDIVAVVADESGVARWLRGIMVDISERKRSEQALVESEGRFRGLFESMQEGFALHEIITDDSGRPADYRFLDVNPAFEKATGIPREEWVGRRVSEVIPGLEKKWIEAYGRVALTGEPMVLEDFAEPLGRWYKVLAFSPSPGQFAVLTLDITASVEAREAEKAALDFQNMLLQGMPIGAVAYIGETGQCVLANDALAALTGSTVEAHLAQNFRTIESWRGSGMLETAEFVLRTGEKRLLEVNMVSTAGKEVWAACQFSTFLAKGVQHLLVLCTDISERVSAQKSLQRTNEQLSLAQRSAGEGIWDWDVRTGRIEWSPELFALFGLEQKEAPSFDLWRKVIHPLDAHLAETRIEEAIRDHKPLYSEYRVVLGSGEIRWVLALGDTTYDPGGEPIRMAGICLDVSDRKQAEERLRESESRFRTVVEQAGDGFELLDDQGRFLDANGATCRALGYSKEELLGMTILEVDPNQSAASFRETFDGLIGQPPATFETVHRRKDGTTFPVEVTASVIEVGNRRCTIALTRDITARKRLEEERRHLELQLQRGQKMESLGSLAGGIAHDMNNVLAAIMALASVHRLQAPEGSSLRASMDTITKACDRGGSLVKGLLGFARQGLVEEVTLDLNNLLQEQVNLLERTTLQRIQIRLDLEAGLRPIKGDPATLSHAVLNLCVNAVDAMGQGGTLSLSTRNAGHEVEVEVEDTGCGMSREVLDRATEPFFTTKPQGQGTGLGLSIVYGAVKSHGGRMEIESHPGAGTRVRLRFPACAPETREGAKAPVPPRGSSALKVLLVDDDDLVQASMSALLEELGHAVQVADSGEAGLRLIEEGGEFDVVILDLNMPGLGGAGTLPLLRKARPDLPVLVATGKADQAAMDLVARIRGTQLLPKPFSLAEVQRCLAGLGALRP